MQKELDMEIDIGSFEHLAFYNEDVRRIEMHLKSRIAQEVRVAGKTFSFKAGETIHTESSYKYSLEDFKKMAQEVGFRRIQYWTDSEVLFSVQLFETC